MFPKKFLGLCGCAVSGLGLAGSKANRLEAGLWLRRLRRNELRLYIGERKKPLNKGVAVLPFRALKKSVSVHAAQKRSPESDLSYF